MKGIKPQKLGLLTRPFQHRLQHRLAVSALYYFRFDAPDVPLSEVGMWKFLAEEMSPPIIDEVVPKSHAEFLVHGSAYNSPAAPQRAVRVRVGEIEKKLYVFGDRFWKGNTPTDPVPFTEMPIRWTHAFGGKSHEKNPAGKGVDIIKTEHGETVALPNIEDPNHLIASPSDRPAPMSLGAMDISRPERAQFAGTYDQAWLEKHFPGFAEDIDWRFFNLATPDQHQDDPFELGTGFVVEGMHPEKPVLEGRLPRMKARAFANLRNDDGEGDIFVEIPLRPLTVWLFPHAEKGVLIYQGALEVRESDATDVHQLVIAAERPGEPKSAEHYREAVQNRLDPEKAGFYAARDGDFLPEGCEGPTEELAELAETIKAEGILQENMRQRSLRGLEEAREMVKAMGLDPDAYAPAAPPEDPEPPSMDELPAFIQQMQETADTRRKAAEERIKQMNEHLKATAEEMGVEFTPIEERESPKGPPEFRAATELERMRRLADIAKAEGARIDSLEAQIASPEYHRELLEAEARVLEGYRAGAHLQDPAETKAGPFAERLRLVLLDEHASGVSFEGRDLTGIDLAGANLTGANFRGALLESANLENANLSEADFTDAVLAHARLSEANLTGATLQGANLGRCTAEKTELARANLKQANLSEANLKEANLTNASLEQAQLYRADCEGANFTAAGLTETSFVETSLQRTNFAGAELAKCTFLNANVSGVDFTLALLQASTFVAAEGDGALFRGAKMRNVRFVKECSFAGADFSDAVLDGGNLRGVNLKGAILRSAQASHTDFSEAVLTGAQAFGLVARESRFMRTDLRDAILTHADLFGAFLTKADLRGTNLERASLYGADFSEVWSDESTTVKGSNQRKTRYRPLRAGSSQPLVGS